MRRWIVDWLIIIGLGVGAVYLVVEANLPARDLKIIAVLGVVAFIVGLSPGIMYLWEHRRKENG